LLFHGNVNDNVFSNEIRSFKIYCWSTQYDHEDSRRFPLNFFWTAEVASANHSSPYTQLPNNELLWLAKTPLSVLMKWATNLWKKLVPYLTIPAIAMSQWHQLTTQCISHMLSNMQFWFHFINDILYVHPAMACANDVTYSHVHHPT
jgi:hypothetical protein